MCSVCQLQKKDDETENEEQLRTHTQKLGRGGVLQPRGTDLTHKRPVKTNAPLYLIYHTDAFYGRGGTLPLLIKCFLIDGVP